MKLTAEDLSPAITQYVQSRMINGSQLIVNHLQSLVKTNKVDDLPKRPLLTEAQTSLKQFLQTKASASRWLVVSGLRGTGKTTLLGQLYLEAADLTTRQKTPKLFVSLDEVNQLQGDLAQTLEAYQALLGVDFGLHRDPILLFIDEVQADPNWAAVLKIIYDRCPNIFIFCTGSSAAALQLNADTHNRRAVVKKLYPLSLIEFFEFHYQLRPDLALAQTLIETFYYSDKPDQLHQTLIKLEPRVNQRWSNYDRRLLSRYLTLGSLPFTADQAPFLSYTFLKNMTQKVILDDLRQTNFNFSAQSITAISRLITVLADSADVLNLAKMMNLIGVSKPQLLNILEALVQAELLIKIPAHGNQVKINRLPVKYRFMSPSLRLANQISSGNPASWLAAKGILLEDLAALHYYRYFNDQGRGLLTHPYSRLGGDCDFILNVSYTHKIALEFGFGQKKISQLEKTMKKTQCRYGLLFSESKLRFYQAQNIISVPLDYFYLS